MERQKKSKRPLPPRKLPTQCLCCGETNPWVITKVNITAPFRSTTHDIRMEMHQCRHCDAVSTTSEQFEAISIKVRETHIQWMAAKLKKIQKQLGGISLRDIAERTPISSATLGRISSADHLVEESIEALVFFELEKLLQAQKAVQILQLKKAAYINEVQYGDAIHYNPISVENYRPVIGSFKKVLLSSSKNAKKADNDLSVNISKLQFA
jgi:hypothetical protein